MIDLDVHQGNGTAAIFRGDPDVYTFSIHQEDNYPVKERSDRDIGLVSFDRSRKGSPWVDDELYLTTLDAALPEVLDESRPDLVLYQAGADPYEGDQLGASVSRGTVCVAATKPSSAPVSGAASR